MILYSAEIMRPGEYATDAKNVKPRKRAYFRMDPVCFGSRTDRVALKRRIARKAINKSQPT
jgi:hypothetical protein